jgi:hypothetical protein
MDERLSWKNKEVFITVTFYGQQIFEYLDRKNLLAVSFSTLQPVTTGNDLDESLSYLF